MSELAGDDEMLEKQKQLYHVWDESAYLVMNGRESRYNDKMKGYSSVYNATRGNSLSFNIDSFRNWAYCVGYEDAWRISDSKNQIAGGHPNLKDGVCKGRPPLSWNCCNYSGSFEQL
jgi:hypothetical protein